MARRLLWSGLAVLVLGALGARPALAQTDIEVNGGVQFNFSRPGARSLGMGGASVGLDGDPGAAFSNPGGLTTLARPEASVEGRSWRYTSLFTDSGRLLGTPSGHGIDTVSGLVDGEAKDDASGLSSAFLVYPKGHWAIGAYYVSNVKVSTSYRTQGAFSDVYRLFPTSNRYDLKIDSFGGSIAYRIANIASIGVSVMQYHMTFSSLTERYEFTGIGCTACDLPGQAFGPPDFSSRNLNNQQTQNGDSKNVAFAFGFTEKLGEKIRIGYSYRKGPTFKFDAVNRGGNEFNNADTVFSSAPGTFHMPDVLSLGGSFRPGKTTTISAEYKLVRYALLADRFALLLTYPAPAPTSSQFSSDNANEFHLGIEHVLLSDTKNPVAVRIGGWYDPQHGVYFNADPSITAGLATARFPKRDSQLHGSGGLGLTVAERFRIDAAVDVSKRVSTGSVSAAVIF